jgi:hypothetical protein
MLRQMSAESAPTASLSSGSEPTESNMIEAFSKYDEQQQLIDELIQQQEKHESTA